MRVGIDARITYYSPGGISNYTLHLIEALAALNSETEYRVLQSRKDRRRLEPGPNFCRATCWTPSHHQLERWALSIEVARLRLDLLHSPDFIPPAFGYRRSVITVHDLNFLYYPQFLTEESRRYYKGQIAWAVRRADHILADSHATRADLIARLNVPPGKVTPVHLAADPIYRPLPEPHAAQIAARYGLSPGFLLFVGTLEPRKNVPGLLRAYRALQDERGTDAPLVLVGGKGWLYDEIFALAEELKLQAHLRFLHTVSDADLVGLYNTAALLVAPSFYEGFGLPALEAMQCGTPVVVGNRASLPEVVGEAGLLVDPEDPAEIAGALHRLLSQRELQVELREKGLAQAARFTWERTARETWQVYRRVVG